MVFTVHVLYPNEDGAIFDMDYYLSTHMPLVANKWTQYGLQKWDVIRYYPGPDGAKPAFSVCAVLTWGAAEELGKAMGGPEAPSIMGDIPNFSDKQPILVGGETIASS